MTLTSRSSSDAFARALEGRAPADAETDVLAALAARLEDLPSALPGAPDPAYRDALRRRLLAVAAVQGLGTTATAAAPAAALPDRLRSWGLARRSSRAAALAAGGLAGVVAIAGVGTAGSRSLPGDPFYGVKTAAESVQLAAADGAYEEGVRHLQFADTRLREVRALAFDRPLALGPVAAGAPVAGPPLTVGDEELADRVGQALDALDEHLRSGEEALVTAHEQGEGDDPLALLAEAAAAHVRGLRAVAAVLPPEVAERALASAGVAAEVATSATALQDGTACDETCRPVPAPTTPSAPTPGTAARPCGCPAPQPRATPEAPTPSATALPPPTPTPSRSASGRSSAGPTREPTPGPEASPTDPTVLPLPPLPPVPPAPTEPPSPAPLPLPLPTDLPTSAPPPVPVPVPSLDGAARPAVPPLPELPAAPAPLPAIG